MKLLRRNTALMRPAWRVAGTVAVLAAVVALPVALGAAAGALLGYGWRRGAGAGIVFSMVATAVRGVVGAMMRRPETPPAKEITADADAEVA
jgi:hypothetical protein